MSLHDPAILSTEKPKDDLSCNAVLCPLGLGIKGERETKKEPELIWEDLKNVQEEKTKVETIINDKFFTFHLAALEWLFIQMPIFIMLGSDMRHWPEGGEGGGKGGGEGRGGGEASMNSRKKYQKINSAHASDSSCSSPC